METGIKRYNDTVTMAKRCLALSRRNPDTVLTSILLPALMMILFVSLFGKIIRIGETSYINYIVPGVLLQCIGQCSATTAIMMNKDVTGGIMSRFSTLPIKRNAVIKGHIAEAYLRNMVTSAVVLTAALALGFHPTAGVSGWLIVIILLTGVIFVLSQIAVMIGMMSNSAEGASALSAFAIILPYLSSGFVPVETLPEIIQNFARYQPMTPIIDTIRTVFNGKTVNAETFWIALGWCAGLMIVFHLMSSWLFQNKLDR